METKRVTIAEKQAIFRNRTAEVPFYHTEFDGVAFPYLLSEGKAPIYLGGTFKTRQDDVFLVAYPKSGTNWLAYIVDQFAKKIVPNIEGYHGTGAIPFLELNIPGQLDGLPSPRYMYTHFPYHLMPHTNSNGIKYIIIVRNPRDVAVSLFHFKCSLKKIGFNSTWEEYLSLFIKGKVFYGSYFDHILEWWKHKDDDNVLLLKYEDLKKDLTKQVGVIGNFLGYNLSEGESKKIAEKCTFKNMKENRVSSTETNSIKKGKSLYRKGIVGDWRNHFSNEQLKKFNLWCNSHLEGTGLEFDFG